MSRRTGTNFLGRLIRLHPDCTGPNSIYEDFLVSGVASLEEYVSAVSREWNAKWDPDGSIARRLREALGSGIEGFIRDEAIDPQKRPVFKTPSVAGLRLASRYFSDCDIVVLVRYGPAVVESGMRSFHWDFETACRRWGEAARLVVEVAADQEAAGAKPITVIRYEDLLTDLKATLLGLFGKLGLNPELYDFAEAEEFPVVGSSTHRGGVADVHWRPVNKTADFNPLQRAAHWSAKDLDRFDRLSGGMSAELGYDLAKPSRLRRLLRLQPSRH